MFFSWIKSNRLPLATLLLLFTRCSSTPPRPPEPAWIHQPARTMDAGYIVYVGTGADVTTERAQFKAQGAALEDLGNECSFPPKGTRTEDRYEVQEGKMIRAYAKLGLTFEECEAAKKAIAPEEVRKLANAALTEQIKRYQDMVGGPGVPPETVAQNGQVSSDNTLAQPPSTVVIQNNGDYFVARQQVFYAKQVVILSPPTYYATNSVEYVRYYNTITPTTQQVYRYEVANPGIRTSSNAWSNTGAPVMRNAMPAAATRGGSGHNRGAQRQQRSQPRRRRRYR